jgi:cobalt-zinc-cadmium efflux system protein
VSHGDHDHRVVATDAAATRALWIALVANGGFLVVEVAGGIAFDSLALLADAAHMASDVVGLVIALIAQSLVRRPASSRRTFGWRRAEALGAQANAVLILAVAIWIFVEAANRISDPADVAGGGMLAVATAGLVVNVVSAVVIARSMGRNLNMRGAFVHMLADAAGSVGVVGVRFAAGHHAGAARGRAPRARRRRGGSDVADRGGRRGRAPLARLGGGLRPPCAVGPRGAHG